jgi:hypothetical protein
LRDFFYKKIHKSVGVPIGVIHCQGVDIPKSNV